MNSSLQPQDAASVPSETVAPVFATPFTEPHWSDPRVVAVAEAIWNDSSIHAPLTFPREEAVRYWPGISARLFVAMNDALRSVSVGTKSQSDGVKPETPSGSHGVEGGA